MSVNDSIDIIIPTSPEDRKALNGVVRNVMNALIRQQAESDFIKEACKEVKAKYGIKPKFIRALAKDWMKDEADKRFAENEAYQELFDVVVRTKSVNDDEDEEDQDND